MSSYCCSQLAYWGFRCRLLLFKYLIRWLAYLQRSFRQIVDRGHRSGLTVNYCKEAIIQLPNIVKHCLHVCLYEGPVWRPLHLLRSPPTASFCRWVPAPRPPPPPRAAAAATAGSGTLCLGPGPQFVLLALEFQTKALSMLSNQTTRPWWPLPQRPNFMSTLHGLTPV